VGAEMNESQKKESIMQKTELNFTDSATGAKFKGQWPTIGQQANHRNLEPIRGGPL
jgi:hypothetical protein